MKNLKYILLLLLVVFPSTVFAAGSMTTSESSVIVELGSTKSFDIVIENSIGFGTVATSDATIASIDTTTFETGTESAGKTIRCPVVVTGNKVGTTEIVVTAVDMAVYEPLQDLSGEVRKVTVTVVEKATDLEPEPTPTPTENYTIAYNANGGSGAPSSHTKEAGVRVTLSTKVPTRKGYEFIGWNTKKDGSGTSYESGGVYSDNQNVTLYAQWKQTENVTKNPTTGDTLIYVVLTLTLGALIYSYWYMKKSQEN